ncbi:AAA family ATPase [Staphylococcus gallinarum]|uniref:AAA family ATPase n=1 Tax=Staphylococcus gallinarum TaxID=1293 RepID=UPI0021751F74|nr:AAA family ATPase [Staphylococcus gallinarum]
MFPHAISTSESKFEYYKVRDSGKGKQGSYQLGIEVKKYFFENDVVVQIESNSDKFNNYKLKKEFNLELSNSILDKLDDQYKNEDIDIIFTLKNDGKFDIRKTVNEKNGNKWFSDLYDNNVSEDIFKVIVDLERKIVEFDIESKYSINSENLAFESKQKIYYGAPGTGKSYRLKQDAMMFGKNVRRVTFHPNMLYGDFVGNYKPFPSRNEEVPITYKFVPGVLIKALVDALKNPRQPQLLIIEELNRANVSATFGSMFQLLDRESNGSSEYPIEISEDLKLYFEEEILNDSFSSKEEQIQIKEKLVDGLIFPNNLYIWCSMNSADQGVLPLDTAFKRRWDFEYFSVDDSFDEELFDSFGKINIGKGSKIKWNNMRVFLNDKLSSFNVPEDKLMGPFFLSKNILNSDDLTVTKAFKNKVLMYLFEDIGSQYRNKIFNVSKLRLSFIRDEFDRIGEKIFSGSEDIQTNIINEDEIDNDKESLGQDGLGS